MKLPTAAPPLSGTVIGSLDSNFVIAEWRDAGGGFDPPRYIAPLHLHRDDDEAWYVLEGRLCVLVGDSQVEVRAGAAAFVPRDTRHTYWNPAPEPARYLLVMTGNIYRLIQEIHALKERTPVALANVFRKYNSELLT